MKRTLYPKLFGLLGCALCWTIWPSALAFPLSCVIISLVMLILVLPVFNPRSNFYIPTFAVALKESRSVALTFDDGPDPRFTPQILDFLDRENIQAAFFVVGSRVLKHPDLLREIVRRGHIVGGHSFGHGSGYHFSSGARLHEDFAAFDRAVDAVLGLRCGFYRAPQGFRTPMLADVLRQRNLICVGWSARGFDSVRTDAAGILKTLTKNLFGGSILVLHDGAGFGGRESRQATLETLPLLVAEVRAKGLGFERLDTFLSVEAYSSALELPSPKSSERSSVRGGIKNPLTG